MMAEEEKPVGELFSLVYCQRGIPLEDSVKVRRRLGGFCTQFLDTTALRSLAKFLTMETGLEMPMVAGRRSIPEYLLRVEIVDLLNSITLIWRFFQPGGAQFGRLWHTFVIRVFHEENMRYRLDELCGVHYLIDEAFEDNRVSILPALQKARYVGLRDAFENAYRYLSSDTKTAARFMFESLEILARLMFPEQRNLNGWLVRNKVKSAAMSLCATDSTASKVVDGFCEGLAQWVDAMHCYRHGQGLPEPVSPPLELCVYILSSGTSFLRWLVDVDQKTGSN